jgi:hypothetical protein
VAAFAAGSAWMTGADNWKMIAAMTALAIADPNDRLNGKMKVGGANEGNFRQIV